MSDVAWSRPEYRALADYIEKSTGLVFSEARRVDVERTFDRHAESAGERGADRLRARLQRDVLVREALVAELTVGETYFFRDRLQFDLLEQDILPAAARRGGRGLRLWSAGCASGEEAYTLSILLDRLNLSAHSTVHGTDIARPRLQHAQIGLYSAWSLRGLNEHERTSYFTTAGKYYRLRDRFRRGVEFQYLNLAEDALPSIESGIWGMDVILCRNVLIYFHRSTVAAVAERLIASLAPDGWLLLSATDPVLDGLARCEVVTTSAGLAYRRLTARWSDGAARQVPARAAQQPPPAAEEWLRSIPETPLPELAPEEPQPVTTADPPAASDDALTRAEIALRRHDFLAVERIAAAEAERGDARLHACWVRALANQGRLDEAGRVARSALDRFPLDTELLYLTAMLLGEAQHTAAAIATLRRALYLDRTLTLAHVALARLHARTGERTAAQRSLRNARTLLEQLAPEATVPLSDGEPARRMLAIVTAHLSLLEAA